jgi:hypothetical protein
MTGESVEDRIENEVRRRIQDLLSAAGVDSDRVGLEVLYWLPSEFMRYYRDLFERALKLDGGEGTAKGMVQYARLEREAKEKYGEGEEVKIRAYIDTHMTQNIVSGEGSKSKYRGVRTLVGGGGKGKYKNAWTVGDDQAFEEKGRVDRELVRLAQGLVKKGGEIPGGDPRDTSQVGVRVIGKSERSQRFCKVCGKVIANDWVTCPYRHL